VKSEGNLRLPAERQRRNLGGPPHRDVSPVQVPGFDQARGADQICENSNPEQSAQSNEAIDISSSTRETVSGKPRRRKMSGLLEGAWPTDDRTELATVRPKFTAVGQLKAVFNSWINILLFAAPVGSRSLE
jgi:Ca2+:H+ antiporter